jgi:5'-methylthioadenosine phosphorylase
MTKIGIIGGSGLDDPKILKNAREIKVKTPYGAPTSPLTTGRIGNAEVAMLARHGRRQLRCA